MKSNNGVIRIGIQQGSLASYRVALFRALNQQPGFEVTVVHGLLPQFDHQQGDGFEVETSALVKARFGPIPVYLDRAQWTMATSGQFDVVIYVWNAQYLWLWPSLLAAKWKGVPTILWGHGYSKRESFSRRWARELLTRLATSVLVYDRDTAAKLRQRFKYLHERVFYASNAIDQEAIASARVDRSDAKLKDFCRTHSLDPSATILFVSRYDPANRLDLLLESASQLVKRHPTLKVVIIGKGNTNNAELQTMVQRLNLTTHVLIQPAVYNEQQLALWFGAATMFCYPANIGLSVLHAFGYGVPVITHNDRSSQNPEFINLQHDRNGLLYESGSSESLQQAIDILIDDPRKRNRLSQGALQTAAEVNISAMVEGFSRSIRASVTAAAAKAESQATGTTDVR